MTSTRRFALVRHGRTDYNAQRRLNGDPAVPVALTSEGREQVRALRPAIARLPIDLAVRTRFPRTRQTLDLLLDGRDVPRVECPDLGDVRLGMFEGGSVDDYRRWRDENGPATRPPGGGESRLDVLARYTRGFERLLGARARFPLAVIHDVPIRFLANAANGDDPLDGPVRAVGNASLLIIDEPKMRRGVAEMRRRLGRSAAALEPPDPPV